MMLYNAQRLAELQPWLCRSRVTPRLPTLKPECSSTMSLADALNPHLSENIQLHGPYVVHDAEQPAPIDQDEEMDDLFGEDAVVDQAERYYIPPMLHTTAHSSTVRGNSLTDTRRYRTAGRQTRFLMPNCVIERQWNTRRKKTIQSRTPTKLC